MEGSENRKGVLQEWYATFVGLLQSLSQKLSTGSVHDNSEFASIATTPESQQLIQELCDEIDEEYELRREVSKHDDPEAWFDTKTDQTLDELAEAGIIDTPSAEDYAHARRTMHKAIAEAVATEAEQTAAELNMVDADEPLFEVAEPTDKERESTEGGDV
jgi:hypothetical protein